MKSKDVVKENLKFYEDLGLEHPGETIAWKIEGKAVGDSWAEALLLVNGASEEKEFVLPTGDWKLALDEKGRVTEDIIKSGKVIVPSKTGYILYR